MATAIRRHPHRLPRGAISSAEGDRVCGDADRGAAAGEFGRVNRLALLIA
jgi:hypothetical protein